MADGIGFNFDEVNKLVADLGSAPVSAMSNVRKAVEVAARNVKDDWRKGAKRRGLTKYAASIDYDLELGRDGEISAEVGPNRGKAQGTFGFVEDAPGGVRSSPQHAGRDALKREEPDFVKGIEKAAGGIL